MSDEQPTATAPPAPEAAAAPTPTPAATATATTATDAATTTTATADTTATTAAAAPAPAPQPEPEPEPKPESDAAAAQATQAQEKPKTPPQDDPTTPIQDLWATAKAHEYPEIWGVTLADPSAHIPSQIVLQKYLNANDGDLVKAKDQLTKTLDWRKKTQPLELIKQTFSKEKFGGLGYVTTYSAEEKDGAREIFTWNVYGNVKSIDVTFGDPQEFINWRVALMEQAVQELSLATATVPITADPDADPYKMFQVHDYKGVSFLRQAPQVKAASTETIRVFATAYPELLKEKFFINVPAVMGFMYGFMKLFVAARTIKKFHPMSNGANLAKEDFGGSKVPLGQMLPPEYGGKGADLKTQGTEPLVE
ncbi:CRAL-TRIO domain-containing protein [Xylaria sp. FL1777]|nr:CRAL-TRIO domain-containing protein [Xylaria sp. FL1777]